MRRQLITRRVFTFSLLVIAMILVTTVAITAYSENDKNPKSPCETIPGASALFESGMTPQCGIGQASDGRLEITVHGYHFAQEKDMDFHFAPNQQAPLPDEIFLMLNVTVVNVGAGNTSIGAGWEARLLNGSSYVYPTNFIANVSFTGYPNQTIPNYVASNRGSAIDMPPGSVASFWVIFYVPFGLHVVPSNIEEASAFKLQFVMYRELSYGGTAEGYGAFDCQKVARQRPDIELIVEYPN